MKTLFENATVFDGSLRAPFKASVLVQDSSITAIGQKIDRKEAEGASVIDCTGLTLCPGFMDIHAHSDLEVLRNPTMSHKVQQGITFDLSGNCGVGVFPRRADDSPAFADIIGHYPTWTWTDYSSYKKMLKPGINMGFLQGHSRLRMSAIDGNPNRKATKEEISKMCALLDKSLSEGCLGMSSGLYYAPCLFADHDEIFELLKVVKSHNSLFCVHHRCEGDEILESIDEIISYVRETGVRLEVSHLKAIGRKNQDKIPSVLKKIHDLRNEGFDVAFDQYPYEYGSTSLFSLLPPRLLRLSAEELSKTLKQTATDKELRDSIVNEMQHPVQWDSITELCPWEDISIVTMESFPQYSEMTLAQVAEKLGLDPFDALFSLLSDEKGYALMSDITQTQDKLRMIFDDDLMSFGTDALYTGQSAHPRSANAAIHLLCQRCKDEDDPWEVAINKMTRKVADRLGLKDRGRIEKGCKADLVLFDRDNLKDNSSLHNPYAMCDGLDAVMVNGTFALYGGKLTGTQSGEIILGS